MYGTNDGFRAMLRLDFPDVQQREKAPAEGPEPSKNAVPPGAFRGASSYESLLRMIDSPTTLTSTVGVFFVKGLSQFSRNVIRTLEPLI